MKVISITNDATQQLIL